MTNYTIALVMIVKNEARAIQRCLNSVASYVDSMIVLDTGSTDNTVELAKECGASVYHFNWGDDFSAARNAALAYSAADWNLILDADEWLEAGAEQITALRNISPDFVGSLAVTSSYCIGDDKYSATSIISRLLPQRIRYSGIIHEQPQHNLPVKELAITLKHDGYEPQQRQCKQVRNVTLLQQALDKTPGDSYLQYKLGVEYEVNTQPDLALPYYEAALKACHRKINWRLDLVIRLLFIYQRQGRFEKAFSLAEQEQALSELSADYDFALGNLYLDYAIAQPQKATELIAKIEQFWLKCLEIGEVTGVNGAVAGRGSYLAAHNLAVFYQSLGHMAKYQKYSALARQ